MRHDSQLAHGREGIALLEVLIALTILGIAGAAVTALALDSGRLAHRTWLMEKEVRQASAFLDHVVLWNRDELDRRLGDRPQGAWRLNIERRAQAVYTIEVRDSAGALLLRTQRFSPALHQEERADASR